MKAFLVHFQKSFKNGIDKKNRFSKRTLNWEMRTVIYKTKQNKARDREPLCLTSFRYEKQTQKVAIYKTSVKEVILKTIPLQLKNHTSPLVLLTEQHLVNYFFSLNYIKSKQKLLKLSAF